MCSSVVIAPRVVLSAGIETVIGVGIETVIGVGHVAQSDGGEGCMIGADYTRLDLFTDFIGSF